MYAAAMLKIKYVCVQFALYIKWPNIFVGNDQSAIALARYVCSYTCLLLQEECDRMREAIDKGDTTSIQQMIQQDSIDINADIGSVSMALH